MPSNIVIKCEKVSKAFQSQRKPSALFLETLGIIKRKNSEHNIHALNNISFTLKKGETIGIIGKNGSGKSTLLQIICGTLKATSGTINCTGRIAALLELGAGFNPEFTGLENIYLNASILGLSKKETDDKLESIIKFADIGDFINREVKTYSSGMFVRLAFSIIVHVDADILIIDEALAVGDVFFTQKCMRFLRNFKKNGSILFVSHDTGSVTNLCDKAIWLDSGILKAFGDANKVCEQYLSSQYIEPTPRNEEKKTPLKIPTSESNEVIGNTLSKLVEIDLADAENAFGIGGATITNVRITNNDDDLLTTIQGGEIVNLKIEAKTNTAIDSPLIGFHIKDKLGQLIFGDNTFIKSDKIQKIDQNKNVNATFNFTMPFLTSGPYTISVAIAEGTQENHKIHHWIHDAIAFYSQSHQTHGLIGVPMHKKQLDFL